MAPVALLGERIRMNGKPYTYFACSGLSLKVRGSSGAWYDFTQGVPVAIHNVLDANKFRGQWDVLYECDQAGHYIPTHPDDKTPRPSGEPQPLTYVKMAQAGTITAADVIRPPVSEIPAVEPTPAPTMESLRPARAGPVVPEAPAARAQEPEVPSRVAAALDDDPEVQALEARKQAQRSDMRGRRRKGR